MEWVKRNLYWVIGGVGALGLLGFSGYYLYSNLQQEKTIDEQLSKQLEEWKDLESAKPHPDDGSISAAKQDLTRVKDLLDDYEKYFTPFDFRQATDSLEFKKTLEIAVDQLRRQAKESDVLLQTNYYFSFEAQRLPTQYDPASLRPLGERLAEVTALCQVLFKAKVKSVESIQRISAGRDDTVQSDLVGGVNQTTNSLAIITPYQVTFVAFTSQFADVINGFAQCPHCFLIKSLVVTTNAPVTSRPPGAAESATGESPTPGPAQPGLGPSANFLQRMQQRYGPAFGGGSGGPGSDAMMRRYGRRAPTEVTGPATGVAPAASLKRGPETILEEVPLRSVMQIDVVKVLPPSERGKYKAAPARPKASGQEPAADGTAPPAGQEPGDTSGN
jgi:hypothetical protein